MKLDKYLCLQLNIFLAILVDSYAKVKEQAMDAGDGACLHVQYACHDHNITMYLLSSAMICVCCFELYISNEYGTRMAMMKERFITYKHVKSMCGSWAG
jgi:hypothetical protein